ncbi:hypothetical protein Fuma_04164 [Fuerstiella marisgermanici]|uniref:Uncharacterized protein n=1 Tax=Fuerstiella marisgermanici TaxID=1891926 RepID=A0A1P8WKE2_9PLAN|nr:hypothetical protein Fuma_04164 [Fuerstiella marisgermanici]
MPDRRPTDGRSQGSARQGTPKMVRSEGEGRLQATLDAVREDARVSEIQSAPTTAPQTMAHQQHAERQTMPSASAEGTRPPH